MIVAEITYGERQIQLHADDPEGLIEAIREWLIPQVRIEVPMEWEAHREVLRQQFVDRFNES